MSFIENSWFTTAMVKATTDMWEKGWDERNGGNVSLRLTESDLAPFSRAKRAERTLPLSEAIPELAGQSFLVTGTGKFFRNVQLDPERNLGVIRILPGGAAIFQRTPASKQDDHIPRTAQSGRGGQSARCTGPGQTSSLHWPRIAVDYRCPFPQLDPDCRRHHLRMAPLRRGDREGSGRTHAGRSAATNPSYA